MFSIIIILSHIPIPKAPPLAPSPITTPIIGTFNADIVIRLLAIAWPWPRSSAPMPGYAPIVSMKDMIGKPNFSASCITRRAFLYPSGRIIPKLRCKFSLVFLPFCWPIHAILYPSRLPKPVTTAVSSIKYLSP